MRLAGFVLIAVLLPIPVELAVAANTCKTAKVLREGAGDPARLIEAGFFTMFSKGPINAYVPVVFSVLNNMTAENRYKPEASFEACKARIEGCGGKFLSEPNIFAYCVKTDANKRVQKISHIN